MLGARTEAKERGPPVGLTLYTACGVELALVSKRLSCSTRSMDLLLGLR